MLVTGTLDPWHPACVRGAAGLQFAQPVFRLDELPVELGGREVVAVDPLGTETLGAQSGAGQAPEIFAFGTERHGLGAAVLERASRRLAIPMRDGVSSLNLATSVAVVLYGIRTASGGTVA